MLSGRTQRRPLSRLCGKLKIINSYEWESNPQPSPIQLDIKMVHINKLLIFEEQRN